MHIVLSLLGAIVTIFYILDRLGIDVGGLNPWSWRRRRAWAKRYHGDPIYSVEDPMQVAAILVVGTARLAGDVTAEQKQAALSQFESTFSLGPREANELYASSAHLLGAPQVVDNQLAGVMERNATRFSPEQAESIIAMAEAVAATGGTAGEGQRRYLDQLRQRIRPRPASAGDWA